MVPATACGWWSWLSVRRFADLIRRSTCRYVLPGVRGRGSLFDVVRARWTRQAAGADPSDLCDAMAIVR